MSVPSLLARDNPVSAAFAAAGSSAVVGNKSPLSRASSAIVLVGLMGAGKTTVGQRLANRLQLPFVDSDREIEQVTRLSIAELFERYGEAQFRDGERRLLARLIDGKAKVIATGGGAFMNGATRALILGRAVAIWLDADVDTLAARTARRPGQRPLLHGRDPCEVLTDLAAARNPIYAQAHLRILNQAGCHRTTVDAIVQAIDSGSIPTAINSACGGQRVRTTRSARDR